MSNNRLHLAVLISLKVVMLVSCSTTRVADKAFESEVEEAASSDFRPLLMAGMPFRRNAVPFYHYVPETADPEIEPLVIPESLTTSPEPTFTELTTLSGPLSVRTTAYCHAENDHVSYGKLNAAGTELKYGMVCSAAADWSHFPVGTRFRISDQPEVIYEVDDYGSALVGTRTLDLYRPTMGSMDAWGVRNVRIEILQLGSYQESLRLMRDRIHFPHVRRMVDGIQRKLEQPVFSPIMPVESLSVRPVPPSVLPNLSVSL